MEKKYDDGRIYDEQGWYIPAEVTFKKSLLNNISTLENKFNDLDEKIIMLIHYITNDEETVKSLLKEWYFDKKTIKKIIKIFKD